MNKMLYITLAISSISWLHANIGDFVDDVANGATAVVQDSAAIAAQAVDSATEPLSRKPIVQEDEEVIQYGPLNNKDDEYYSVEQHEIMYE